jgi:carbonic anhydrase
MISAREALRRLQEGNRRYVSSTGRGNVLEDHSRRAEVAKGQHPFAIILGCSDSRVPPEIVFDQGLGNLFVVRVAGNVVEPAGLASIEFAVKQLKTRLVVVLGHSRCGAVLATLEQIAAAPSDRSLGLRSFTERISPSVRPLWKPDVPHDSDELVGDAVRANIRSSVEELRRARGLHHEIEHGGVVVLGAEYSLETGVVEFLEHAKPR